jgi:signal transduction histidine kinase/BarA-like signal transduction histidine kinase
MSGELTRELEYLRRLCELDAGKILSLDAQCIALRVELEQKRRGFGLLAGLTATLRHGREYMDIFVSVARRLNSALNMQRTVVLMPGDDGNFAPEVLQGYPAADETALKAKSIKCDDELLDTERSVLVNGGDPDGRLADFREALGLKYFISSTVTLEDQIVAIVATGRLTEEGPFMSRLAAGDVETVETVCSHLAALVARHRVTEAEERTKIMLDATPVCCMLVDSKLRRVDCNEAAIRLFGASDKRQYLDEFDRTSPEFQPNGRRSDELFTEMVQTAFKDGYARFEWVNRSFGGESIPSEITLVRLRQGSRETVASYTRDLREQRAMLGAMLRKEDELRAARDQAEKNARAKSEFMANISHELRTPLNAIIGMGSILEATGLDCRQRECLSSAMRSANLLRSVVDDMLTVSAIDSGRVTLKSEELSVRRVAENVRELMTPDARAKSLEMSVDVAADVPECLVGDATRLEQVLLNCVSNAVKFTPRGGVRVRVSLKCLTNSGADVLFEVEDTGIGMTDEQVSKLFAPFYQADASSTRKYGGAGLGLAICRGILDLMGGEIWCESREGAGSKFMFELSLALPKPEVDGHPHGDGEESFADLAGMRVLLVEDNEINQMVATELLSQKGIETEVVGNGLAALILLNGGARFDLILMDIQMPEMDGITATMRIRENPMLKSLPIIALTAHALPADRELSLRSGMNDHLTKPIDSALLYKTLRRWGRGEGA